MSMREFITNQGGNTLLAALQDAVGARRRWVRARGGEIIATAFMSPAGFGAVANLLERAEGIQLLVGAEQARIAASGAQPGDPPQAAFEQREVAGS